MVEIVVKITDRDDNSIDLQIRGSIYEPASGYIKEIGRALAPKLTELILWVKDNFPAQTIHITEHDTPLKPRPIKPDEPWKFPGRE